MDSSGDRNHILEDFQACTNIDDISRAITILEDYNWDLLAAINSIIPQQDETIGIAETVHDNGDSDLEVEGTFYPSGIIDITEDSNASAGFPRMISFTVMYHHEPHNIHLPDTAAVGVIKRKLSPILHVPFFQMCLVWEDGRFNSTDTTILRELHLPRENMLHLIVAPSISSDSFPDDTIQMRIVYKDTGKAYDINFRKAMKVAEIKRGFEDIVNLCISQQVWSGWPTAPRGDDSTLSECCLSSPLHMLDLRSMRHLTSPTAASASGSQPQQPFDRQPANHQSCKSVSDAPNDEPIVIDDGENSEDADIYHSLDDDDSLIVDQPSTGATRMLPLLPEVIIEYDAAAEHFNMEFTRRYGPCRPDFFVGGLEDAVRDSLHVPARERRPLIIYLHHDKSVSANIFCSQVLCSETVVNYLMTNFVIWAWDLTLPANKDRLVSQANTVLGSFAGETIQRFHCDQLPLLLIMSKSRSNLEILTTLDATVSTEELMNGLIHVLDLFQIQQRLDIVDQDERDAREMEKYQQDTAYAASLAADRAKEEAKRKEETERQFREAEARAAQENEDALKQALLLSLASDLPTEPDATTPALSVSTLRVRCPDGSVLHRRFFATDKLRGVLAFIASKGYLPEEHRLLVAFPKRELDTSVGDQSLKDLQLYPQETLILEHIYPAWDANSSVRPTRQEC